MGVPRKNRGATIARRWWWGYAPALLLTLALAFGGLRAVRAVAAQEVTVEIANFAYAPATITIAAGDSVRWRNDDIGAHSATADNGEFDTGLLSNGQTSGPITFATPGTYKYHCSQHGFSMFGTIVVQGASQGGPILTLTTSGSGGATANPPGAPTGPTTARYTIGESVTLTAQPANAQTFVNWVVDGAAAGWANPVTITMNGDHAVRAVFAATPAFGDVPAGNNAAVPIAQLAARGVINGCDATAKPQPLFCPGDPTLRHQMAALIVRAMPGWADETGLPTFTDNTDDAELMRRVATVQRHNVAQGYQPEVCQAQGKQPPCYGPLDPVKYGQTLLFIARAMVERGYWVLQPDDRAIFPDQNGAAGADPATDRQTLDHRMVVTYVKHAGAPPDVVATPGMDFRVTGVPSGAWGDDAPRAWFARALWQALNLSFQAGQGGYIP